MFKKDNQNKAAHDAAEWQQKIVDLPCDDSSVIHVIINSKNNANGSSLFRVDDGMVHVICAL